MKYSYSWLQSHIEEPLPAVDSLKEAIIFHAFEVEGVEQHGSDSILDINVLPDRAGDCLSHYGMAREIAGLLTLTLKNPDLGLQGLKIGEDVGMHVEVQSELCRRYMAVRIDGVKVGPSPDWLRARLESVGQKSINNVVDITNFILFDTGQPTHAYDAAKIDGGIVVRVAKDNEHLITLSGEEKSLRDGMLVIADYVGALGIAGVKGGKLAEVTNDTTSVILEIANFDPASVRKTSRSLNLITDASKRFENNVSPEVATSAASQLAALVIDLAGGTIAGMHDHYPSPATARTISFSVTDIAKLLGESANKGAITNVFDRYGYEYNIAHDVIELTVPYWRSDITGAHDVSEEIGRVIGYEMIVPKPLPFVPEIIPNETDDRIGEVKKYLINKGFSEVMTYSFRAKGEWYVARGPKDKSALRTNLSDGLKESFDLNSRNMPLFGMTSMKLFEIGTVFLADHEEMRVATCDNGAFEELPLDQFAEKYASKINATDLQQLSTFNFPLSTFKMWSPYPFIIRDVAVWLPIGDTDAKSKLDEITNVFAVEANLAAPIMFDSFEKEGRVSYAYRFIFQSFDRTLTDQEVAGMIAPLQEKIKTIPGAVPR